MEPLLKSFSLGFLLRSVFAGAFFVVAYQAAASNRSGPLLTEATPLLTVALPLSLFAGVTVYGLHRALLYPFIEFAFGQLSRRRIREHMPLISNQTVDALLEIWGMAADEGKKTQECARQAAAWGDMTHLQYVSALCIGAGAFARVLTVPGTYVPNWPLIGLAIVFAVAGLASDWRLGRVRDRMRERMSSGKGAT